MLKRIALMLVLGLLVIGSGIASAQDATPAATPSAPAATPSAPRATSICNAFADQPAETRTGYYMGEGIAYLNTGQLANAEQSFTCIIAEIDADYVLAYMARGLTYMRLRDFDRALPDFNQVIQRQPDSVAGFNNRGVLFALQFDFERAAQDFERALAQDNGYLRAVHNRALIYTLTGDFDAAINLLQERVQSTGIDDTLAQYRNPNRPADAATIPFDPMAGRLYALLGIVYSAQALDNYQNYITLEGGAGRFPDERITAASGALESRFTFELRLDDGSLLLLDETLTE